MEFYQPPSSSNGTPPRAGHGTTAMAPPDDLDLAQLGMMESLARKKGMSLSSYLDFLKAYQTSEARSKPTSNTTPLASGRTTRWSQGSSHALGDQSLATGAFGRSEYGHGSNPQSHDAYPQLWSDSSLYHAVPLQHHLASETLQFTEGQVPPPSSSTQWPVQPPAPSQTSAAAFGGGLPLNASQTFSGPDLTHTNTDSSIFSQYDQQVRL
jgi:hypothetical protein